MDIMVLGPNCPDNRELYSIVEEVSAEIGLGASVKRVNDIEKIMQYEIIKAPALVINGKVRVHGVLPTKEHLKELIEREF